MYICMYVHVCLYICNVYMYACMYVYMHIYMHIYMHFNDLQFSSTRPRSPQSLGQVSAYGPAPCGRPHRKLKLESIDIILSSFHAKKLASFLPEFRLWTEKSGNFSAI